MAECEQCSTMLSIDFTDYQTPKGVRDPKPEAEGPRPVTVPTIFISFACILNEILDRILSNLQQYGQWEQENGVIIPKNILHEERTPRPSLQSEMLTLE